MQGLGRTGGSGQQLLGGRHSPACDGWVRHLGGAGGWGGGGLDKNLRHPTQEFSLSGSPIRTSTELWLCGCSINGIMP